jgi:phospholipase C
MKFAAKTLLLSAALAAALAHAQSNNIQQVQHVIVVIQENRTPDNLFQQDQTLKNNGAHIVSQGSCDDGNTIPLQPMNLSACWDSNHSHSAWKAMWDKGKMDGACRIPLRLNNCTTQRVPTCPDPNFTYCPQYSYVQNTLWDGVHGILDPYFKIAEQYGWANYMFQTNQGPSFPAHQFLFSGTSAPIAFDDPSPALCGASPCYQWFDAENTGSPSNGCIADYGVHAHDLNPASDPESYAFTPETTVSSPGFPCYDHASLPTLLGNAVSWKYYARFAKDLWTAPTALDPICQTTGYRGECSSSVWKDNVGAVLPKAPNYPSDEAPFLTDIDHCHLPQVSWVIPDGNWSDHSGFIDPGDAGPSWVAAIVNAIGQDTICEGGKGYWSDTVILITWDDWGGLYDDVVPPDCPGPLPCTGYSNNTGQQYVYGFRVPLLVVGAYAKQNYISGAHVDPPLDCLHNTYCHDFGSILNFIEYAFGTGGNPLGGGNGIGDPHYPYADALVMDTNPPTHPYSLYDFFEFTKSARTFQTINGARYPPTCFHGPAGPGCFAAYPVDPDNDANED